MFVFLIVFVYLIGIVVAALISVGKEKEKKEAADAARIAREVELDREKRRLADERAQEKFLLREQQKEERKMEKICDNLEHASTIKRLSKAMSSAQSELSNVNEWRLGSHYSEKYCELHNMSDHDKARRYNQKIEADFASICNSSIADMKNLEEFASDVKRMFRQIDDIADELPAGTKYVVAKLREEVGLR